MDMQHLLCGFNGEILRNVKNILPELPTRNFSFRRRNSAQARSAGSPPLYENWATAEYQNGNVARKHLPLGSGPYTVGCVDIMSDPTVKGTFIRLYYPTTQTDVFKREAQWPLWLPRKQYGNGYAYFRRKSTKVFGTLLNWIGGDVYVPVLWQAPVLNKDNAKFPVVIFTHGLGGNRTTYTTVCTDIASQGFIVAAIEHRDGTASMTYCYREPANTPVLSGEDGYHFLRHNLHSAEEWLKYERQEREDDYHVRNKQLYKRVKEVQRALDLLDAMNDGKGVNNMLAHHFDMLQFKGLMEMDRLAIAGHSFGGATVVASCAKDKRFKVGVALDSWMHPVDLSLYSEVTQPVLFVNTEIFQWAENVRGMYNLNVNEDNLFKRVLITIKGTCHQSQTDFQFMTNASLAKFLGMRHTLDPHLAMGLNNKATVGFLAKHLDIPRMDCYDDILSGKHDLIIRGTNLDLDLDSSQ